MFYFLLLTYTGFPVPFNECIYQLSMNIDQLVFKLLEVTLVLVRKSLKFLLLRNQVPIVGQSMNNRNCLNFFPDENFLSDETSLMLFHIEKLLN